MLYSHMFILLCIWHNDLKIRKTNKHKNCCLCTTGEILQCIIVIRVVNSVNVKGDAKMQISNNIIL